MMSATLETSKEELLVLSSIPQEPVQVQELHPLVCKDLDGLDKEYMLQLQHEETHTQPAIPSEPTLVGHKNLEVVEHNVFKVDFQDLTPSRGCPIRHLALQKCKLPLVMLIPEYEGEDHKEEKACFSQVDNVPVLERSLFFSIRKGFHVAKCFLCLSVLATYMPRRKN